MNSTAIRKPTPKMFDLVRTILIELGELNAETAETWRTELNLVRERGQFDFDACQQAIEDLKQAKRNERRKANSTKGKIQLPDVPEGRYAVEIEGELKFYEIEVSDSGFVTGFVRASDERHPLQFRALLGVLKAIEAAGIKESALRFAVEIGECMRCHRALTSKWRLAGIGPECSKKG